jgi:hypothetical protein
MHFALIFLRSKKKEALQLQRLLLFHAARIPKDPGS